MTDVFTLSYAICSPKNASPHHYGGNFATLASAKAAKAAIATEFGKGSDSSAKFDISIETLGKVVTMNVNRRIAIYTAFYCETAHNGVKPLEYTCGSVFLSRQEADAYVSRIASITQGPEIVCIVYKSVLHGGAHRISEENAVDILKEEDRQKIQLSMRKMEEKMDIRAKIAKIESAERGRILYCMAPPTAAPLCREFPSYKSAAAFVVERRAREIHARTSIEAQQQIVQAVKDARLNVENTALRAAYIDEMDVCVRTMGAKKFRQSNGAPPTAEEVEFIAQFIEGAVECRKLDVSMYNSNNMFCSKSTERAAPFAHSIAVKFMTPAELEPFVAAYASCRIFLRSLVIKEKILPLEHPLVQDASAPIFSDFTASFSSFDS